MKKVILIGMMSLVVFACDKKDDATPQVQLSSAIISSKNETAVRNSGEDLQVKLISVNDSRCPSNAVCIVAGSADVVFNVSDGSNQTDVRVIFNSFNKNVSQQEFKLGGQTYSLTVSQILPYPETSKIPTLEEYKISISIEKI